jgi:hypothetical protein
MARRARLVSILFGSIGLIVTVVLFAYLEFTNYATLSMPLRVTAVFLCPASLMTILLIDVEPHTWGIVAVWSVIALTNAILHGAVAAGIAKLFSEPTQSP